MQIHGLTLRINWSKFIVGASIFIPCLDTEAALASIVPTLRRLRYRIKHQVAIDKGIYGLRIWRIK
jgi:hypothetical protein